MDFHQLYKACLTGDIDSIDYAIVHDVDISVIVNKCHDNGSTPFYIACQNGYHEIVEILLKNNANINMKYIERFTPLYVACRNGHLNVVKQLILHGADLNAQDETDGSTPLYVASQRGHYVKL